MKIVWPNDQPDAVYSPSTVIKNYFTAGDDLTIDEFEKKATEALSQASKRVLERFGYECTSAMGELARLNSIIKSFPDRTQYVKITSLT